MSLWSRYVAPWSLCLVATLVLLWVSSGSVQAQESPPPPPENVVQINIVNSQFKLTNRGVGLCKNPTNDCSNQIVWKWIGADPNPRETEKIVINYVKGTNEAYNCFQDTGGNPKLSFEILARQSDVTATVSTACPAKSAWLYQISCVRTDPGYEGTQCTGIAPVDPGAVIG